MSAWVSLLFVLVVAALNILRKQGRVVLQEPGALHWIPLLLLLLLLLLLRDFDLSFSLVLY